MSDQPRPRSLGERIKYWRERRGLSQRALAQQARVDVAWINRLESGIKSNISFEAARRIAYVLQISLDYLAGVYNGEQEPPERCPEAARMLASPTPLPTTILLAGD